MIAPCVRVVEERAEETRSRLLMLGILRRDLKPKRDGGFVLLPVMDDTRDLFLGYTLRTDDFETREHPRPYQERVQIPDSLRSLLPTSFDIVGDVAIMKLPEALLPHKTAIGQALLAANRHARIVALDHGVKDSFRVRELEILAGEGSLETTHTENGLRLRVDPSRVYFSPRLATERARIAALVQPGECVLDLFAGVGPFSILIAKRARPQRVYAVDANPDAMGYLRINVELNHAETVVPILGDAADVAVSLPARADRIVMNLPHDARRFLPSALAAAAPESTIHYHAVLHAERVDPHVQLLVQDASAIGWTLAARTIRKVHGYSPGTDHFAIDLQARRK